MKKVFAVVVAVLLASSMLLAGCTTPAANPTKAPASEPAVTDKPAAETIADDSASAVAPATGVGPMTDAYTRLITAKGNASTRLSDKMATNDELAMYSMALLPIAIYDLALVPISIAEVPEGAAALEMLGMSGIDVKKDGGKYTITYTSKDSDGTEQTTVQTCEYDAATDSLQSTITDGAGKEAMIFESVKAGSVYATQYYAVNDDGSTSAITMVFNETDLVAVGIHSAAEKPASIYKNTSVTVDLVKSAEMYLILQGDKLTIHENGEDKTY